MTRRALRSGSVASATAAGLAGAAIGRFAGAPLVLAEPGFAGVLVVGHRALGQMFPLVGAHHDTSPEQKHKDRKSEESHRGRDHITHAWLRLLYTRPMRITV